VLTLTVEDDAANISLSETITIDINNENDLAPFFLSANAVNFTENDEVIVLDVDADDNEGGAVDAGIVYSIVGGADASLFNIGEAGFLSFITSPDFDVAGDANADNVYEIAVEANDGLATVENIQITVTDLNDESPVIAVSQLFNISEAAINGDILGTVTASDIDGISLQNWTIGSGNEEGIFAINTTSGELTIGDNKNLDFETTIQYVLTLTVEDDAANISLSETITIDINNENDLAPFFLSANAVNFTENSSGTVLDVDADDSEGGAVDAGIVYSIVGGADASLFNIGEAGFLSFITSPDFDVAGDANADNVYEIAVEANDGLATVENIQITVTDLNDESPVIAVSQFFNISEAAINGDILGTVTASDIDGISLQNWTIGSGNEEGIFAINTTSGELTIGDNTNLDFETTIQYVLTLTVEDDAANISASETITIDINNENDLAPFFLSANAVNFTENDEVIVLDVDADDSEGGAVDAGIVYSIVGGADASLFNIGEAGFLSFITSPDFDVAGDANADNVYEIAVEANDGLATVENIQITVTDLNDESPVIAVSQFFIISEAAINGDIIGTVSASDIDGISLQNWTIGSGNEEGIFAINRTSGELTIGDNTNLDFETTIQYVLTLTVEDDAANISASETITIDINNENDLAPFFLSANAVNFTENGEVIVLDVDADDNEGGAVDAGIVTVSLAEQMLVYSILVKQDS